MITKPCCFVSAQGYPDIFTLALANFSLDACFFADIDKGGGYREVDIARFWGRDCRCIRLSILDSLDGMVTVTVTIRKGRCSLYPGCTGWEGSKD